MDGSSTAVFGLNGAGNPTTAPQLPVRGYGGFVQAGFPLSRWFNAEPKGRNAGWQAYFEYGLDAAVANDFKYAKGLYAFNAEGNRIFCDVGSRPHQGLDQSCNPLLQDESLGPVRL